MMQSTTHANAHAQSSTAVSRGKSSELKMFRLLEMVLNGREGFSLRLVNGLPHHTDIMISKEGENDICIELKDHTEAVATAHVRKFTTDILAQNLSGIMVSISSDIQGKNNFQLVKLLNGKYAMFLSNNKFDAPVVKEIIMYIYEIEGVARARYGDGTDNVTIAPNVLLAVNSYVDKMDFDISLIKSSIEDIQTITAHIFDMTCMEIYLSMTATRRKLDITFKQGKFTEVKIIKKNFLEFFSFKEFVLDEAVLDKFGCKVVVKILCRKCRNVAKMCLGKCYHCQVDYCTNRAASMHYLSGMEIPHILDEN